jgi:hypothetical protein
MKIKTNKVATFFGVKRLEEFFDQSFMVKEGRASKKNS